LIAKGGKTPLFVLSAPPAFGFLLCLFVSLSTQPRLTNDPPSLPHAYTLQKRPAKKTAINITKTTTKNDDEKRRRTQKRKHKTAKTKKTKTKRTKTQA
jgi:hypothetical protein